MSFARLASGTMRTFAGQHAQGDDLALELAAGRLEGTPGHVTSWLFRAPAHRGLDGDLQAGGKRRTRPPGRSAAEDGGGGAFLVSARNGRRPGEESRAAAVAAQAIEVPTVLRPDQAIERPRGRAPNSMHGRRPGRRWLPRTRGPAFQAGRRKPWRADRTGCNPPEPRRLRGLSSSMLPAGRIGADFSKLREGRVTAEAGCRSGHPPISRPIADEADGHPCLTAPASRRVAGPSTMRRSSGGTNSAIRAQAVPPTATAPTTAKATRHASDGMPIWAKPSVPL